MDSEITNGFILMAIDANDLDTVKYLLDTNDNINNISDINGKSLLILAIDIMNIEFLEFILQKGADPNIASLMYSTPFGYLLTKKIDSSHSINYIHLRIILMLLRYGANPDIKVNTTHSSRELLQNFGYEISGIYLVKKEKQITNDDYTGFESDSDSDSDMSILQSDEYIYELDTNSID